MLLLLKLLLADALLVALLLATCLPLIARQPNFRDQCQEPKP
jgi:hypothetical protein